MISANQTLAVSGVPVELSKERGTGGDTGHVAVVRVGQLEDPEYDFVQRLLSCRS